MVIVVVSETAPSVVFGTCAVLNASVLNRVVPGLAGVTAVVFRDGVRHCRTRRVDVLAVRRRHLRHFSGLPARVDFYLSLRHYP